MSKGYPSCKRTRKAFERGVKAAKTGRGMNPYANTVLKDLFERGRARTPGFGATAPNVARRPSSPGQSPQSPRSNPPSSSASDPSAAAWERAVRNSQRRRA